MPSTPLLKALAGELNTDQNTLQQSLLGGDESLTPNYFYVDATGQVHAVFTGGVDILANQGSFSTNNHIAWRETVPGGAMVAEMAGYKGAGTGFPNDGLVIGTPSVNAGGGNAVKLQMDSGGADPNAALFRLYTGGWIETLKRSDGFSEYQYNPVMNSEGIIAGPTYPGASNTVIAGGPNFTLPGPKRALITFSSFVQHNGVNGVAYSIWVFANVVGPGISTAYYIGSMTDSRAGYNAPMSGAVVTQQLNAGTYNISFYAVESASPTWGIYDWSFSVGILPTSFPVGATI